MSASAGLLAKLVACGLNASGIAIVELPGFFGETLLHMSLSEKASFSESKFECVFNAGPEETFVIENETLAKKYSAFSEPKRLERQRVVIVNLLKAIGKGDNIPFLSAYRHPLAWVHAVEKFCGFREGEVFVFENQAVLIFKDEFRAREIDRKSQQCLGYTKELSTAQELQDAWAKALDPISDHHSKDESSISKGGN